MKQFCTTLTLALALASFGDLSAQAGTWVRKNDVGFDRPDGPAERQGAVAFTIGSKGYVATGHDGASPRNDLWEFDPALGTWSQKADFAGIGRSGATGFAIGDKGYLGTGTSDSDFWEYDPQSNTWTRKADFGGGRRYSAAGFSIGSKGYIGTGTANSSNSLSALMTDLWEYDPVSDEWTRKADLGFEGRYQAVGIAIGTKGYIGLGRIHLGQYVSALRNDFWEYDPVADTWTRKADFGGGIRALAVGFTIGDKGYVGTGEGQESSRSNDFWEYDPDANTWSRKADFGGNGRRSAVGFAIGTKGYIGTGSEPVHNFKNDLWEYDPMDDSWLRTANLGGISRINAASFTIGDKGYVVAGWGRALYRNDLWEYDHSTDTWAQKADFGGSGRREAVGFSIGSKGYVGTGFAAGVSGEQQCLSCYTVDFWEYDPASNEWTRRANFGGGGRRGAVGFAIGTKGYIGTGFHAFSGGNKRDFYEYDPLVDTWTRKADFGGTERIWATAFQIGMKGYIGTGKSDFIGYQNDLWEYDPSTNLWTPKAAIGGDPRQNAVGFAIGNKGYMGLGNQGSSSISMDDIWEYDPIADAWTRVADFGGGPRSGAMSFVIGPKGYVGMGEEQFDSGSHTIKSDLWEYTPGITTHVKDPGELESPCAWPIPASTTLFLAHPVTAVVYDLHGRAVGNVSHSSTVDLHGMAPGTYILLTEQREMVRFVKE